MWHPFELSDSVRVAHKGVVSAHSGGLVAYVRHQHPKPVP
jgi:hypothetical protein